MRSYPKVYNLGHRALRDLFLGPVVVQEKIDGSQFSFGVIDGQLVCRSRGRIIEDLDDAGKLFSGCIATARTAAEAGNLVEGHIVRGEAMMGPRHNTLTYDRTPRGNFVLFDIDQGDEDRIESRDALEAAADLFGCELTPEHYRGEITDLDEIKAIVEKGSFLGGAMEGLVFKNYARFGIDGKMLMGKYVTQAFRETHSKNPDWKPNSNNDILAQIKDRFCHEQRWTKAVERRRDNGELLDAPQDIGPLIGMIQKDVHEECRDEIAGMLYDYFRKKALASTTQGFPQWYQERLAEAQFEVSDDE